MSFVVIPPCGAPRCGVVSILLISFTNVKFGVKFNVNIRHLCLSRWWTILLTDKLSCRDNRSNLGLMSMLH